MPFCGHVNLSNWESTIAKKENKKRMQSIAVLKNGENAFTIKNHLNKTSIDETVEKYSLTWNKCSSELLKWS